MGGTWLAGRLQVAEQNAIVYPSIGLPLGTCSLYVSISGIQKRSSRKQPSTDFRSFPSDFRSFLGRLRIIFREKTGQIMQHHGCRSFHVFPLLLLLLLLDASLLLKGNQTETLAILLNRFLLSETPQKERTNSSPPWTIFSRRACSKPAI